MNDMRERIVQVVARKGPVLPVEIMKELGGNTIIIGAMLSELASKDRVKITSSKVGGSPLYYVVGQEPKLVTLYDSMNDKDKKSFDALKKEGVLRDADLTPIMRVSLRNIKDFAKPLEVTVADHTEIFWRWFLLPMKDAETGIRKILDATKDFGVKKKTRFGKPSRGSSPKQRKKRKQAKKAQGRKASSRKKPKKSRPAPSKKSRKSPKNRSEKSRK